MSKERKKNAKVAELPLLSVRVRELRFEREPPITQLELAESANLAEASVNLLETGRRTNLRESSKQKLADAFTELLGHTITVEDLEGPTATSLAMSEEKMEEELDARLLERLAFGFTGMLNRKVTPGELKLWLRDRPSDELLDRTLKEFRESPWGEKISDEDIEELREKTVWQYGKPNARGWFYAWEMLKSQRDEDE